MSMAPETPNDPLYMSAPTSPRRIKEGLCFLSAPTSPTRRTLKAIYGIDTEPTTPKTWEASSSNSNDADEFEFEFETSRRFNVDEYEVISEQKPDDQSRSMELHNQNLHVSRESLPAMAFADELFSDGKVMPLKPPPRLQYPDEKKLDRQISSSLSSPRSPTGVLRLPFHRSRSLWNDDFDPFMVAWENVKDEKMVHRRSRSMSPFREPDLNQMGLILPTQQSQPNLNNRMNKSNESSPSFPMWDQEEQVKLPVKKSCSITLAEPKGVVFARRARLVKPSSITPTPSVEAGESAKEGGISCSKETKSQKKKIINFLFWGGSMRKNGDMPKSSNARVSRLTRKFSLKSMGLNQYNEGKRVSEMNRITLLQYRPKLLVCMGYGAKYVQ